MNCPFCSTDLDAHPDNDCLDAWVAQAVLGKSLKKDEDGNWLEFPPDFTVPDWPAVAAYSRDAEAMQTVVAALLVATPPLADALSITARPSEEFRPSEVAWTVRVLPKGSLAAWMEAIGGTMPLAVCRAAIREAEWRKNAVRNNAGS